jgi:cytochrome c556
MRMTEGWLRRVALVAATGVLAASFQHAAAEPSAAPAAHAAPASAPSKEEAEGIIFERQQIMTQLDKDAETLGMIASGAAPAPKLAETTRAVAQGAKDSLEAFRMQVPGGRAKPEVWANYEDFMQRMTAFSTNAEKMAKLGETGNVVAVTEVMIDALPCKQCHDLYRAPKR